MTKSTSTFGDLTDAAVGIILKEVVRRAIIAIRHQRFVFESHEKGMRAGKRDYVTSADLEAQKIYVRVLKECFPQFGIIGEEEGLLVTCRLPGRTVYFTVDPLDGTSAYRRRQSHGIGTMIALVVDGEIVAAYVGDVMTQEIFGYRPGSNRVHRISEYEVAEDLVIDPALPLHEQYVLMREEPPNDIPRLRKLVTSATNSGLFKALEIGGGSIGISFARLWKGEVGAIVMQPYGETPWDSTPIVGISRKLGFEFISLDTGEPYDFPLVTQPTERSHTLLVLHRSRLQEFRSWDAAS